jgi:glycosyltransferase involved in cell wall biosynthesis
MRIAHLSTRMDFYGGEVCLGNLASGLNSRGHEVCCVVKPGSRLESILPGLGIEVVPLPLVDWFEPLSIARVRRVLQRRDIQILHTHLPRDYFIAAAATLGTAVANIGTRHQINPISHAILKRPFLRRFKAMISVSDAVRDSVSASGIVPEQKVVTIHNGIAMSSLEPGSADDTPSLRARAGVDSQRPVIGFVGKICPTKGIETLLRAAALARLRHPYLQVFLVGEESGNGAYAACLGELAEDLGLGPVLHRFGFVDGAAYAARDFDVQVVCSLAEPFGLVTLEAMANGKPVVVTDTGGSPEIVRDGVEGFLFKPGDAETLARRLELLLESPGLCREMGRRGRDRVRQTFSRRTMLDRTEALYESVIAS